MLRFNAALFSLCLTVLVGCSAASQSDPDPQGALPLVPQSAPLRPPLGIEIDAAAMAALNPARIRLGRLLFFDRRLSADGTVACASCHRT
jgi:cytochrome c peroxidase